MREAFECAAPDYDLFKGADAVPEGPAPEGVWRVRQRTLRISGDPVCDELDLSVGQEVPPPARAPPPCAARGAARR